MHSRLEGKSWPHLKIFRSRSQADSLERCDWFASEKILARGQLDQLVLGQIDLCKRKVSAFFEEE